MACMQHVICKAAQILCGWHQCNNHVIGMIITHDYSVNCFQSSIHDLSLARLNIIDYYEWMNQAEWLYTCQAA